MTVLLSAPPRRLDLDVVLWPAAMPCDPLRFSPKPCPRELTLPAQVREVGIGLASGLCAARDDVAQQFSGPKSPSRR